MNVRHHVVALASATALLLALTVSRAAPARPNILLLTVDDMNHDTPSAFGGKLAGVTPNIDRLATQGLRFLHAHVAVAVCQPSRQCIMTGSFPQTNGSTGFYPIHAGAITLPEILRANGYHLGILGKVLHLQPPDKFPWDVQHDMHELGAGRDPERYHALAVEFLKSATAAGKPFFLMANSHDPHRPFSGADGEMQQVGNQAKRSASAAPEGEKVPDDVLVPPQKFPAPSRTYRADEVPVPGFLPDLPDVRKEMAQYYSSARRADATVGRVLDALQESGQAENTIVIFLSDNGIAVPFAKSNCYLFSTRTPLIIRWPGKTRAGSVDAEHFVSGVDLMPTLLEGIGLPLPEGMDGRSFLPLLGGAPQANREHVFTCYNETAARVAYTMRAVQDASFGYIHNAWSDGKKTYRAESMIGLTYPAMQSAAASTPAIAARVEMFLHRVPEEFYDLQNDPDALHNLIDDPRYRSEIRRSRAELLEWMRRTHDPAADAFEAVIAVKRRSDAPSQ